MPSLPFPSEVLEFLRRPNPAVITSLRPDGWPHAAATWYSWEEEEEEGHVLLNMDESRRRLRFMRTDPRVALAVLDYEDWGRYVTLFGRIVRIEKDSDLADIDRLAIRYAGVPFRRRDARRYSASMKVESWYGWEGSEPWRRP
jgi:PPOX class probable F420-dependent enzyme